jgi:hypothetical protein
MKVAQYEVLGWRSEKATRPGWDDRPLLTLLRPHARDQKPNVSIVPGGANISFLRHFPALRTGLLSLGPSGTFFCRRHVAVGIDNQPGCHK